jgi:hypothetical protein
MEDNIITGNVSKGQDLDPSLRVVDENTLVKIELERIFAGFERSAVRLTRFD